MNLALRDCNHGGKGRGEAGEVTGVVANTPTTDGLEKRYGAFGGWGMAIPHVY